jgi:hypothetical protein
VQKHVLDHLHDFVAEQVEVRGRQVNRFRWGTWQRLVSVGMHLMFYVCPKTGILKLAPIAARKKRNVPAVDPDAMTLDDGRLLRRIAGVWYEVTLVAAGEPNAGDVRTKRQLDTRALEEAGLRNHRRPRA